MYYFSSFAIGGFVPCSCCWSFTFGWVRSLFLSWY